MKKKVLAVLMVIGIGCAGISAQAAGNVSDTALPTKKIEFAYSKAAQTPLRTKEDKTSHYIKNNSGFDLWVRSLSSSNVNCTLRDHAIVKGGEWFIYKSTHNRRERPVCGHRGRSRGPFYYRITTFGKGPWDARDPHKTTFMALKHAIRLSIWWKQKETPGVEKAPGVSSSQRKESGRSGRDDGELRFGYDPAIHARRLRVYHRPRRLRMASRISIFFAARRFEPLNSMG